MPDKMTILGLPNYIAEAYTTVSAPSLAGLVPAGLEASWLKTEEPSEVARLASLVPFYTMWYADFGGLALDVNGVALVNHNVADGGQVRFVVYPDTNPFGQTPLTGASRYSVVPSSVLSSFNATGGVGNITDDPAGASAAAIVPSTTNAEWWVRLAFPAFANLLDSAADAFCVVIKASRRFSGAGATSPLTYPKITVELAEAGAIPSKNLGYRAVTVTGDGQMLLFPFSLSDLTDQTGADLELVITGDVGTSVSGGQYCALETVRIEYTRSNAGGSNLGFVQDSGWLTVPGDGRAVRLEPTRSIHYVPDLPWLGVKGVGVWFRADQTMHNPPLNQYGLIPVAAVAAPAQFLQSGVLCVGAGITMERGLRRPGPNAGPASVGVDGRAVAGQSYGADAYRFREADPVEVLLRRSELEFLQEELGWRRGNSGAFYVAMEPNVPLARQRMTAFWATLRGMGKPVPFGRYRADGEMLFALSLRFEEKL